MPRVILGLVAVVVVAGWPTAIFYFTKWRDQDVSLEISETKRVKLEKDFELIQRDLEKQIESAGRLDEISQQLRSAEDQAAALEGQIQAKRDELIVIGNKIESGEAELGKLEPQLSERKATVNEIEQEIELADSELERLRAEAEDLKQNAAPAQSEPMPEPILEPEITSEVVSVEAEPNETDRVAEVRRRFEIVDKNGDGRVDQFEFRLKSIRMQDQLDTNRDGFVTIDETLLSPEKFKLLDSDGDGKISPVEFTRALAIIDTAGQGFITFEDYLAFVQVTAK
jgi:DNA repair exonuclease SbcCD ATPase subunit